LYPDHVVFLGVSQIQIFSIEDFQYLIISDDGFIKNNPVVIVQDYGVIVNKNISKNAEAMLYCLGSVLLRINFHEKISYLTKAEEMELIGWDAEKYRKSLEK